MKQTPGEPPSFEKPSLLSRPQIRQTLKNIQKSDNTSSLTPLLCQTNLMSPLKPNLHDTNLSLETRKTLISQKVKFDFSFKKIQRKDPKKSIQCVFDALCQKIGLSSDIFDRDEFNIIFQFVNGKQNNFEDIFFEEIIHSAFIICQILRGKLNDKFSLMNCLQKIWGNSLTKKEIGKILKIVDYRLVLGETQASKNYSDSHRSIFKCVKINFVNVSYFY